MRSKNNGKDFCMFALPGMFCFFAVVIVPFIYGVYLTFTDWNGVAQVKNFVGFKNFGGVVKDGQFWTSLLLTFKYVIFVVIIVNVLAFAIAYLLTRGMKGENFFRAGFFTPNLIGGIVLGYIWQLILNGLLLPLSRTLTYNSAYGFWGLVILMCWQQIGYMMIIYIAGLQNVPGDILEAARIDGATSMQTLFKVTIPNVMSSFTICMFLSLTNGFKLFDQNLALTQGGPYKSTEMLALNIYNSAFGANEFGFAQAKAIVFMILVAGIGVTQLIITKKKEVEM